MISCVVVLGRLFVCLYIEREMDEKSIAEAVPLKFDENMSRQVSKHAKVQIHKDKSVQFCM